MGCCGLDGRRLCCVAGATSYRHRRLSVFFVSAPQALAREGQASECRPGRGLSTRRQDDSGPPTCLSAFWLRRVPAEVGWGCHGLTLRLKGAAASRAAQHTVHLRSMNGSTDQGEAQVQIPPVFFARPNRPADAAPLHPRSLQVMHPRTRAPAAASTAVGEGTA